jgi:hypothetical protein
MVTQLTTTTGKIIGFKFSGKLHDEDYRIFVPAIEAAIQANGPVRLLILLEDFHGWDLRAAWDDFKFDVKHFKDVERIAMVGDKKWEQWITALAKPFTAATVMYFDRAQLDDAWKWIEQNA